MAAFFIFSPFSGQGEPKMKRTRRTKGFIVHIGESRSAGFWAVIKARDNGDLHFAYGLSFLNPGVPKVGHEVEFTRLPPADRGALDRAIEVVIQRSTKIGTIARRDALVDSEKENGQRINR